MKIERFDIVPFEIPLQRALETGAGTASMRTGLLVRLTTQEGFVGVGEASPHPLAGRRRLNEAYETLATLRPTLTGADPSSPGFSRALARLPVGPARAALEVSTEDLRARAVGLHLVDWLDGARRQRVPVNALIEERDAGAAARCAHALVEQGFRCLKLKVNDGQLLAEERRLAAIREAVGPDILLRLDFNAAFDVAPAIAAIERLRHHALDYVEQPVTGLANLATVRRSVPVPIAADESVADAAAIDAIAAAGAADVIVVKPALLGLGESRSVIGRALGHGFGVVVTSTLDTSIGVAAALHLAATLPDPIRPCGLATVELLAGDLACVPLVPHDGHLDLPAGPGLGVAIDEEALARWRQKPC